MRIRHYTYTQLCLIAACLLLFPLLATTQEDQLSLQLQHLGIQDLENVQEDQTSQKVVSGSRSLKDIDDLPFTIYVVTKEEIFENGYTTLVDVLKSVPGIRVSQPGSALDGETFMMRGLLGNTYTKILINDVPVKPSVSSSMPIGAQLPIKQAERIEIIFGPAAAIYGADAAAGVINIILKDTDRPIYTQAGLSVGNFGYTNVDVMFGGKLGKDRNIVKFNFYGSNTVFNDRNVVYDTDELYNPLKYVQNTGGPADTSFVNNPNYRGTVTQPEIGTLPHLSRLFGLTLKFRGLDFSYNRMYRRDHSALGLNPLGIAYYNPLNYQGEIISRFQGAYTKNFSRFSSNTKFTFYDYHIDERSSNLYVRTSLNQGAAVIGGNILPPAILDSLSTLAFNRLFSGIRFNYAESHDFRFEQLLTFYPWKNAEWVNGINLNYAEGLPMTYFLPTPFMGEVDYRGDYTYEGAAPIPPKIIRQGDLSAFSQLYFKLQKLTAIVGIQYYQHTDFGAEEGEFHADLGGSFNPRLALLYKINPNTSLRASYSSAFRTPSPFYQASTFVISAGDISNVKTGTQELQAEKTYSYELGGRFRRDNFFTDIGFFYTQTQNLISFNFDANTQFDNPLSEIAIGYFNDNLSEAVLYGLQAQFMISDLFKKEDTNLHFNVAYSLGKEILPFGQGELDLVRGQPNVIAKLNLSTKILDRIHLSFNNMYLSRSISRSVLREQSYENQKDRYTIKGYYTLDLLARVLLTDNFQGHLRVTNLFNAQYGGIDASGTIDDLLYNPQSLRIFQLGVSYRMNLD